MRKRFASGLLAVGLLSTTLFVVDSMASPESADARCSGGTRITSEYWQHGVRVAHETPLAGTCDGDNIYRATLVDSAANDGRLAAVWFQDGGTGWHRVAITGTSVGYTYADTNGTSRSHMRLCASGVGCGWGHARDAYGTNHGY